MADKETPLTAGEIAQLQAALHEGAHRVPTTPGGVDLSPLPERPDFLQKAVDFVTMIDENGLLEDFAAELQKLEEGDGEDGAAPEA